MQRQHQNQQPILLTGGMLHDYQINGVSWLCSLHSNGLNGILADEMGLGKTVQVIAFLAALAERFRIIGPHLIVVPLGVMQSWGDMFSQWCPSASVMVYHGPRYVARSPSSSCGHIDELNFLPPVLWGNREKRQQNFRNWARSLEEEDASSPCVVLTTYEIVLKDYSILRRVPRRWAYLVVDEAHRYAASCHSC